MATSEARALPFFTDLYGQPLESGFIYIGKPGLDPVAYPTVVTSDFAGEVVVQQPVRTTHGHATSAGALIHLFVEIPYSITILDSASRIVYASLNETDPIAVAIGTSSVQSAENWADLRSRDRNSINQVWVSNAGLYVYQPNDNTSPENIPFVIVGNDGGRYALDSTFVNGFWMRVSTATTPPTLQGAYMSWNDDGAGSGYLTTNHGSNSGGWVIRTVNSNATVELGRVTIGANGSITSSQGITTNAGDIVSAQNVVAKGGRVSVTADGTKALVWDGTGYTLPAANLNINGSNAITQATLQAAILANQQANGVGAVALGSNTSVNPVLPGTWVQTGTANNSVYLYVRTA